ncbi:unnamed protein product, partial [Closterium sp. NIES-53]
HPLLRQVPQSRSPGSSSPSLPDFRSPSCSPGAASPPWSRPVRCVLGYPSPLGSPSGAASFPAVLLAARGSPCGSRCSWRGPYRC